MKTKSALHQIFARDAVESRILHSLYVLDAMNVFTSIACMISTSHLAARRIVTMYNSGDNTVWKAIRNQIVIIL